MFFQFTRFFRGYLKLRLNGYAPERFFNLCANHDILLWDLSYCGDTYEFYMSLPAFREIRPLVKKTKTRVTILQRRGLPFFLFRYRKRKMFFFGITLCILLLYVSSGYIWCIEIGGNTIHSQETLLRYLRTQGCYSGALLNEVDCSQLEEQIRIDYPDIIWVSLRKEGTRLFVDVKENLAAGQQEVAADLAGNPEGQGYDIVAPKAGVIQRIVTRTGTPLAAENTSVEQGTVLISGALPIYNDAQEITHYNYTVADADIYLRCSYPYEDTFSLEHEEKIYTGKQQTRYQIKLLSQIFSLPAIPHKFTNCEIMTKSSQLCLLKNLYLPVWLEQKQITEYKIKTTSYSKNEARSIAQQKFQSFLKDLEEKNVEILEKNVIIDIVNHSCRARGSVEVIEKTGVYQKTQEIKTEEGQLTDEFN